MALLLATTPPGLLTKTSGLSPYFRPFSNRQATMNYSALWQNKRKNYTRRKSNTHKLNNQNAEKIIINRNEYSYILSIYTAKITLYSMSKTRHAQ